VPPVAPNRKVILAGEPKAAESRNRAERTSAKKALRRIPDEEFQRDRKEVRARGAGGVDRDQEPAAASTDTSFGEPVSTGPRPLRGNRTLQIAAKFYF
jgi:hypothetical protein